MLAYKNCELIFNSLLIYKGHKQCNLCKNKATYEFVYESNRSINILKICNRCVDIALIYSKQCVKDLAMSKIYELFILFKDTIIYKSLVNDVSHYIFNLSLL